MSMPIHKPFLVSLGLLVLSQLTFGQCSFDVTATISPSVTANIYCSYDSITLSSTDTFDTYQWYFNFSNSSQGGTAIAGATQQNYKTTAEEYGFVYFYLEASRENCTEASIPILVDVWAFLSPVVISYPQAQYCRGDSSMIAIGSGLWSNIQWYRDGEAISMGTDSIYWVKETGTYVVNASPSLCPELELTSGLGPPFVFEGPELPLISQQGDTLFASSGPNYQWFQNGQLIPGATNQHYPPTQSGSYTVQLSDGSGCVSTSAPFDFILSSLEELLEEKIQLLPNPVGDLLILRKLPTALSHIDIIDAVGRLRDRIEVRGATELQFEVAALSRGLYYCRFWKDGDFSYLRFVKR